VSECPQERQTGENGPYRYDGKSVYHLSFPKHYLEDEYYRNSPNTPWSPYEGYTIYEDRRGNIWFGTSNFGICRFDGKSLSWMYEEQLALIDGGGSFGIRSIIEDKGGKFWFCNTSYRYNILPASSTEHDKVSINYNWEKSIEKLREPDGKGKIYFMSSIEDANGDLWMATYNKGVWRYDGKNTTHYSVGDGATEITLFSIYRDKQGNIWLGTHLKNSNLNRIRVCRYNQCN
jgi:ligand-binding sensor domain-containing protein